MRFVRLAAATLGLVCSASLLTAQEAPTAAPVPARGPQAAPRAQTQAYAPTPEELAPIKARLEELNAAIKALKDSKADDDLVVDAESCAWVVNNIVRVPGGFIDQGYVNRCMTLLNDGLRRAAEIKDGKAEWPKLKGRLNRALRSAVDGTAQPYHLMIPASYDPAKPIPLYVYLHGRSQYDPDLGMGWAGGNDRGGGGGGNGGSATPYIRIDAFGRANNSYRWAGETDVLEAIASVRKRYNIDPDRILLSGFSLGGAGSWQLGLHYPDMFCGLEIDAGVIGQRLSMDGLTPVQRAQQATYGIMIDHALNVFNVPLVAYAGENDAQLRSSTDIRAQLVREGYTIDQTSQFVGQGKDINALFLANPKQAHSHATGETLRLINEFNDSNFKRGRVVPDHIKFITYTTRYNHDFWITVDGMEANFSRASVDAQRDSGKTAYTIKTSNVSRLLLTDMSSAKSIKIDNDSVQPASAASILLVKEAGHWKVGDPSADTGLRKKSGLQGPINDAFFDSFLCITPSGQPFSASVNQSAMNELDRFSKMFTRDYLGEARTKADTAVTAEDIASSNLILFGDPGSNAIIAKIADKLPIKWDKQTITVGDKTYSSADHMPVLIYPNPLNLKHYVVINTGLLTPRGGGGGGGAGYGDYAVLKLGEGASEIATDGVFDESWKLPAAK
jgi:pimeloyl-ACP methyl ester carboxylesterase